jgi:hypothetical protein
VRRSKLHRTLRVRTVLGVFFGIGCWLLFLIVHNIWAMELGVGSLDLKLTLTGAWNDNVNYDSTNTEEATEARFMPGVDYTLPFKHHHLSVGYLGTYVTSNKQNARAIRHSPTADLLLDFPGDLQLEFSDIFSRVQDYRKDETEELVGPDFALNQAGATISFNHPESVNIETDYQNIVYRYEPRGSDRDSDKNEVGAGIIFPVSQPVAGLFNGRWAEERVFEHTDRSYKDLKIGTGIHYSGPSHVDLELTLGYQTFVYEDDPNDNIEESLFGKAEINVLISTFLSTNFEIHSDIRSNSAFSGTMDITPRVNTTVHVELSKEVRETFYLYSKYYVEHVVDIMIQQQFFNRFSVFGECQYTVANYEKSEAMNDMPNRKDVWRKWRAGLQYALGNWIELGIRGEYQSRDSNISVAFAEYERTVVGVSATFRTPR